MTEEITQDVASTETTAQEVETTTTSTESAPILQTQQATAEAETAASHASLLEQVSPELRESKSLTKFNSIEDLAKSYIELEGRLGKKVTDFEESELKEYLGVPDSVDAYKYDTGEANVEIDDNMINWFKEESLKADLTPDKSNQIVQSYMKLAEDHMRMEEQRSVMQNEQNVEQLKKDFGPEYDKRTELAKRGAEHFGGEELIEVLGNAGLGSNPVVIKALSEIGATISEDNTTVLNSNASKFGVSSEEAEGKIKTIRAEMAKVTDPALKAKMFKDLEEMYRIKNHVG